MTRETDYFDLHYKMANLFLIIPPKRALLKTIYCIFVVPHFLIICLPAILGPANFFLGSEKEFSAKILNLGTSALHVMSVNRIFLWTLVKSKCDTVLEEIRQLNLGYFLFETENLTAPGKAKGALGRIKEGGLINEFRSEQLRKTGQFCSRISIGFVSYVLVCVPVSCLIKGYLNESYEDWNPNLNKTSTYRYFPFPSYFPFDISISDGYYYVGLFYEMYAYTFLVCEFFCVDTFTVSTIIHLTTHVKILGFAISLVDKNVDPLLDYTQTMALKKRRIVKCASELRNVYKCAKMINGIFSSQLFIQMICMGILSCCSVYRTTVSSATEIAYLSTIGVASILDMLVVCWFNENFTLELFQLAPCLYKLDWLSYTPQLRMYLIFIIRRIQKPFYFTMGLGLPLDLGVFMSVVKSSYSFYTLITQSGSRTNSG